MASLFKRFTKDGNSASPYWWINYRDVDGKQSRRSTGHKHSNDRGTRDAEQMRAEYTLRESKHRSASKDEQWANWVPQYFAMRYASNPETLKRRVVMFKTLRMFLEDHEIFIPRQLTRHHCMSYIPWRIALNNRLGKFPAGHNTAHRELHILKLVMVEAVARQFAPFNPANDLGIKLGPRKIKPEFTEEVMKLIRDKIELEAEPHRTFLGVTSAIGETHGARLTETHFDPIGDVDLTPTGYIVRFHVKGGKIHTVPLHPKLIPLVEEMRSQGKRETYPKIGNPSMIWHRFLHRIGVSKDFPGACFHSYRVTVASAWTRAGVPERHILRWLGHSSTTVSRSYARYNVEDLTPYVAALSTGKRPLS